MTCLRFHARIVNMKEVAVYSSFDIRLRAIAAVEHAITVKNYILPKESVQGRVQNLFLQE